MKLILISMYALVIVTILTTCGSPRPDLCILHGERCEAKDGDDGVNGRDGASGASCSVSATGLVSCTDGTSYQIPIPSNGIDGVDGKDGSACTITSVDNGALIACGENHVVVLNGVDGKDGQDGQDGQDAPPTAFTVTELIDPCGDAPGKFDEVLLRLANNTLIAHYADGAKQFLSVIGPGTYMTTDGTSCVFTVSPTNVVSWN